MTQSSIWQPSASWLTMHRSAGQRTFLSGHPLLLASFGNSLANVVKEQCMLLLLGLSLCVLVMVLGGLET